MPKNFSFFTWRANPANMPGWYRFWSCTSLPYTARLIVRGAALGTLGFATIRRLWGIEECRQDLDHFRGASDEDEVVRVRQDRKL